MIKKIVLLVAVHFIFFSSQALATIELIEKKLVEGVLVHSICVDGYKFLHAVYVSGELYTQFIQVYEVKNKKSQPAECQMKAKKK